MIILNNEQWQGHAINYENNVNLIDILQFKESWKLA